MIILRSYWRNGTIPPDISSVEPKVKNVGNLDIDHVTHPARAKVMLKKNLHKNGVQGFYHEPMVVSKQALPQMCLFLPIVKIFQITFGGKLSLISSK